MLLDLNQIRQPTTLLTRRYDASAFEARRGTFRVMAPVELGLTIHKDRNRYRLVGSVRTVLELPCSRCLESFPLTVDGVFDLRYLPHTENAGAEREIEEDDLAEAFYRDETIDLGQLMEEQFYLAVPMKPLCRTDCKGLCPHCGANLNDETCDCQVRWEDPRLAGLRDLMNRTRDDA